ncbi:MAG: cobalamin-binding protein [Thermoplasmata archaeon]
MRIVSLLPSATEIVCGLGLRSSLVGRSEECDYPSSVRELPVIMHARAWDADRPSSEIDARVRSTRAAGASLYVLDVGHLTALRPDLLLTQDLCGVCSVTEAEVASACGLAGIAPTILSLTPRTLSEVWASVETIGRTAGCEGRARAMAEALRARSAATSVDGPPPRVAVVEWLDPPILAGLWTPEIVERAGADPLGPRRGEPGQRTRWSEIADARPDLLLVAPCSFGVERTLAELREGTELARQLAACSPRLGTWIADEAYFSRPGPRLADGVELIRSILEGRPHDAPMPAAPWPPGAIA